MDGETKGRRDGQAIAYSALSIYEYAMLYAICCRALIKPCYAEIQRKPSKQSRKLPCSGAACTSPSDDDIGSPCRAAAKRRRSVELS